MPDAALVGVSLVGGGLITGPGAVTVIGDGVPISVVGDAVAPHGVPPHDSAHMIQGSPDVFMEAKPACRVGDLASCGHVVQNGSPDIIIDGALVTPKLKIDAAGHSLLIGNGFKMRI